jgi:hypothetical protein
MLVVGNGGENVCKFDSKKERSHKIKSVNVYGRNVNAQNTDLKKIVITLNRKKMHGMHY